MLQAIEHVQRGMITDTLAMQTVHQNVSNMSTTGYHSQVLAGVHFPISSVSMHSALPYYSYDFTQGNLLKTEKNTDLCIKGEGFFVLKTEQGLAYTRRGDFHTDAKGTLVSVEGYPVLGKTGVLEVEAGTFLVREDGTVFSAGKEMDQLKIVAFADKGGLQYQGSGIYTSASKPQVLAAPSILQGSLESSNVVSMDAMMAFLQWSRHFSALQKVMHTADMLFTNATHTLGGSNV